MSSCTKPDRDFFESFDVSAWQPTTNNRARYSHSELGHFSIDEERHFLHNKSKLSTLNLPQDCRNLDIDLNTGFEQWREVPNVQQHLDSILYWILLNKESLAIPGDFRSSCDGDRLDVDFVTSRGNLARILNVLNGKDGKGRKWTLLATRYRGTVYLSHVEDVRDDQQSTFARRVCYWGKRFEVEVTENWAQATSFPGSSSWPLPANEVEQHGPIKAYPGFFSVLRFQLENHRIALRAEVDAEMQSLDEAQNPRSNYVELKVTTETIVRAPWAFKRKRLVPWWCQSIVSGTPLIVYGIRDYDGHVTSINHVRTDDIPDHVGRENLDPEKHLLFLSDILSWIRDIVCVEDIASVYAFQWDPNTPGRGVTANALLRDAGNTFLPQWYVREMEDYFTLAGEQRQIKGVKRAMEDEKQREDQKIKMKGIRRRMEESWPRTTSSREPNIGVEKPHARGRDVRYARSRSPGFHNASERGRSTLEIRDSADEERYSKRESFRSEGYKREHPRPSSRREDDKRRPLLYEEHLNRDRTSTRVYDQRSEPYSYRSSRDKTDKTRRYERRRHEDQVQQQARVRSGKTFNESRSQRFSERDYPSPSDDRMPIKRVKRDEEYETRGFRHQDPTRYDNPLWK